MSEPVKPILDQIIVSGSLHVYISQSARGEMVMGGATDPYGLYSSRSTLDFKESLMAHMLELFPFMGELKVLRQWAGMADMTPDFSPVMGLTPVQNYYIDAGWGTWGFKATPVCGVRMAECIATDKQPDLLKPFALDRFRTLRSRRRKGRSFGRPLIGTHSHNENSDVPDQRAAQHHGVRLGRRGEGDAGRRVERRPMDRVPVPRAEPRRRDLRMVAACADQHLVHRAPQHRD